jgi:hypothetical protein
VKRSRCARWRAICLDSVANPRNKNEKNSCMHGV